MLPHIDNIAALHVAPQKHPFAVWHGDEFCARFTNAMTLHPTHTQALIGLLSCIIAGLSLILWSCKRSLGPKPQPKEDLLTTQASDGAFNALDIPSLPSAFSWRVHEELEQALQKCRETVGPLPCRSEPYLKARHDYHKLLVKHGMLDPKLAEPDPTKGVDLKTTKRPTSTPSRTAKQKKPLTKPRKRVSAKTHPNARD